MQTGNLVRRQSNFEHNLCPGLSEFTHDRKLHNRTTRLILFAFMIMLFVLQGRCLTRAATVQESTLFIDGYNQKLFTYEDGLLSTSSTAIAQTEDGLIWMGGYGGLVRYDGKRFVPVTEKGMTNIKDLISGEDNSLYIASADSGLTRCQDGEFEHILEGTSMESAAVECLAESEDGTLWIGTTDGIGRIPSDGTAEKLSIQELSSQCIDRIVWIPDGRIFCVTRNGQLFVWDGNSCDEITFPEYAEGFRCICYDSDNKLFYIGTIGETILVCDNELNKIRTIDVSGMTNINSIQCKEDGVLWVCSDSGIAVYADGKVRIQRLMMNNSVDKMMVDMEGNDWFVSSRQGILEVCQGSFDNISRSADLTGIMVNALAKIGNRLYAGHDDGLEILDIETREQITDPAFDRLSHVRVRCLYVDDEGGLWIATKGEGLLLFTADGEWKSWTMKDYPALRSDNFRCIVAGEDDLIVGTDSGAYRIHKDGSLENVVSNPGDLESRVLCAAEMKGILYLGTDGYGLYIVENGKVKQKIDTGNGLTSNVIMKFCPGSKAGSVWMITGNSIMYRDPNGTLTCPDNFPASNKLDIVLDEDRTALVLTGNGIYKTTEDMLLKNHMTWMRLYRSTDGQPFEVTANSNQYLEDHVLYYCGSGGVADLRYREDGDEDPKMLLGIEGLRIDGESMSAPKNNKVVLGTDIRRIDIDAHVITFSLKNPYVFYYLEGFEEEPTMLRLSDLQTISYTNLPGGDYRFHFGLYEPITDQTGKEIVLDIHRSEAWYRIRYIQVLLIFLAVCLLITAAALLFLRKSKVERQRLREEYEREEKLRLEEIAYKDYLTGLYNRNYLKTWQDKILPDIEEKVLFISMDCNDLKWTNDHHGHNAGDQLLKEFADVMGIFFSGPGNDIFRIGGDEFLILSSVLSPEDAEAKMKEMMEEAAGHTICGRPISFEYGISLQEKETFDFEEGLHQSDIRMLEAKDRYHNRVSEDPSEV
ncbi:MAG: diguanylate cyclase [Eubacterium sp.]|nr:diguanylate cyclase [Eubacterium sp.]